MAGLGRPRPGSVPPFAIRVEDHGRAASIRSAPQIAPVAQGRDALRFDTGRVRLGHGRSATALPCRVGTRVAQALRRSRSRSERFDLPARLGSRARRVVTPPDPVALMLSFQNHDSSTQKIEPVHNEDRVCGSHRLKCARGVSRRRVDTEGSAMRNGYRDRAIVAFESRDPKVERHKAGRTGG
jgi:hypothetical protein